MTDTIRVTLVFPRESWEEVKRFVPSGKRSKFIVEATKREIQRRYRLESIERLRAIQEELRRKYGEMPGCVEDIRSMREERDAEIAGLC